MALQRAHDLEQAAIDFEAAARRGNVEALRRMLSDHPDATARGTDASELWRGRDAIAEAIANDTGSEAAPPKTTVREGWADGPIGYVYIEGTFTVPEGEFPVRNLLVAHKDESETWRFVYGLAAIPVPNDMLSADSPFALHAGAS